MNEKNVGLESYQQLFLAQKIGKDLPVVNKLILPWEFIGNECLLSLADLEGGYGGCNPPPPFQVSKIKESNKTKQKIEDNTVEKEEESYSCMFV